MDSALKGFLLLFGVFHLLLIVVPINTTLRASISAKSKLAWCAFVATLPIIGVVFFHIRFRASIFLGKPYEPSPHDLGVRKPNDSEKDRH
jgi:hypothetical protein